MISLRINSMINKTNNVIKITAIKIAVSHFFKEMIVNTSFGIEAIILMNKTKEIPFLKYRSSIHFPIPIKIKVPIINVNPAKRI